MTVQASQLRVADVLVTREGDKGWLIRLGDRIKHPRRKTSDVNHVIVFHHVDGVGRRWGAEGRPGGVGWRELTDKMLADKHTYANTEQLKTEEQRYLVAVAMEKIIGTPYDSPAILDDARQALRIWHVFRGDEWPDGQTPGQFVCSAMADWAYEQVHLPNPGGDERTRFITPGDWKHFIITKFWLDRRWARVA